MRQPEAPKPTQGDICELWPLITNEQADRWLIRQHIRAEAERSMTAVRGVYTIEDAAKELRGIAYMKAGLYRSIRRWPIRSRFRRWTRKCSAMRDEHAQSRSHGAGGVPRPSGRRYAGAVRALIAQYAKDRPLAPMPHL